MRVRLWAQLQSLGRVPTVIRSCLVAHFHTLTKRYSRHGRARVCELPRENELATLPVVLACWHPFG